jgi:hypothetical protein
MIFARPPFVGNVGLAAASILLASMLAGCGSSTAPYAAAPLSNSSQSGAAATQTAQHAWGRSMLRVSLPSAGCFEAAYPVVKWSRVACVTPPNIPFSNRATSHTEADYIGNTFDYELQTLPLPMVGAIGSFPRVVGVKTAVSCPLKNVKKGKCVSGPYGANSYSLQLNSNNFWTAVCPTTQCVGWEQFVYTNFPDYYSNKGGLLIIQDWFLKTGNTGVTCPDGWTSSGGGCFRNAPFSIPVPSIPITDLADVSLSGSATRTGDSVFLVNEATGGYPSRAYGMKNAQGDGITDLADHWTAAEFNVFGTGNLARAIFNKGADITVRVEGITGYAVQPKCLGDSGTTGESNNMDFVEAPLSPQSDQYPSILFREMHPRKTALLPKSCDTLPGLSY